MKKEERLVLNMSQARLITMLKEENAKFDNPDGLLILKGMIEGLHEEQMKALLEASKSATLNFTLSELGHKEVNDDFRFEMVADLISGGVATAVLQATTKLIAEVDELIEFNKGVTPDNGEVKEEVEAEELGEFEEVTEEIVEAMIGAILKSAFEGKGKEEA